MDPAQQIATVLGAGGGGAILLAFINGLFKWLSGASAREREKNTDYATQRANAIRERDEANRERDEADDKRRAAVEYAASLRTMLLENGIHPDEWPEEITITKRVPPKKEGESK